MNDYQLRITKHAYKRYRQRAGHLSRRILKTRSQTALTCGLYDHDAGVIKLCGIRWGCVVQGKRIILTTCLGRRGYVWDEYHAK